MSSKSNAIASRAWSFCTTPRDNGVGAKTRPARLRRVFARFDGR